MFTQASAIGSVVTSLVTVPEMTPNFPSAALIPMSVCPRSTVSTVACCLSGMLS